MNNPAWKCDICNHSNNHHEFCNKCGALSTYLRESIRKSGEYFKELAGKRKKRV